MKKHYLFDLYSLDQRSHHCLCFSRVGFISYFLLSLDLAATDISWRTRHKDSRPVTYQAGTTILEFLSPLGILPTVKLKFSYLCICLLTERLTLLFEQIILSHHCFCFRNIFIIPYIVFLFL